MRSFAILFLCSLAVSTFAKTEGVEAIRERRKTMTRVEKPVAQIMKDGALLSVYADDSVKTQAVRMVRMAPASKAKVEELLEDKATLKAAKSLVVQIKTKHSKEVVGLTDAEVVASSQQVFNTTGKDTATGTAVGLLLGAAAAALAAGKKPKEDTNPKEDKPKNEKASK